MMHFLFLIGPAVLLDSADSTDSEWLVAPSDFTVHSCIHSLLIQSQL